MADKKSKQIIIISIVISVIILIFAAVFMHNMDNEINLINEQIGDARLEQESILQEMACYDQDVDINQVKSYINETTESGKVVEKLQNSNLKWYNDHYDAMDSVWANTYKDDKKITSEMKRLFPESSDEEQMMPWVSGWTCNWEFQSVFDYNPSGSRLCWICKDSDNRLLGIAYADYDVNKHAFDDLKIILSKHANDTDRK